ncbi:phasin family protein [Sphingomonas mesophila]|uniref:phasin family protein n=1 Tax=Sphingomonas mesophila TaxID=2303576 RepID=UPI000E592FE9|nr:phasin family protein [Sphingomonas mesophila]
MADTNTTTKTETATTEATKATTAPIKAAGNAAKADAKRAPARKARATKARRAAKRTVNKTARSANRAANASAKAATSAASGQFDRMENMTNDFTKLFAGFEIPAADRFTEMFSGAGDRGQDLVRRSQQTVEGMAELAKANVEALTEASRIAAKGVKQLGQDMLESGREGFEQASGGMKTLADAKSPTEFIQLQTELVRGNFDRAVAESSKFAEAFVKLAGEAFQPLSNRATVNAERMGEFAA